MYAIVKTGGKQYKVAPGDVLAVEKLPGEAGDTVELETVCIVDGDKVEADPAAAAATKVQAVIVEQFKGDKQLVFKFKKRKNYKRTKGHRQQLTRIQIEAVGSQKAEKKAPAKTASQDADAKQDDKAAKAAAESAEASAAAATEAAEQATAQVEEATEATKQAADTAAELVDDAAAEAADAAEDAADSADGSDE